MTDAVELTKSNTAKKHLTMTEPSAWFQRFAPLIAERSQMLDVAAGGGRHVRFFSEQGHRVTAVDKNIAPLAAFTASHGAEIIGADLEDGSPWPLPGRSFDAIIVCNYLHRPLLPVIIDVLKPGGILLYETFARGNEAFNRPRNPDHLLKSGELLDLVAGHLQVIAYQHGIVSADECPGVKQMICAVKNLSVDAEPTPVPLPGT